MLDQCGHYISGGYSSERETYANDGTDRHSSWKPVYEGDLSVLELLELLEPDQADAVQWAADYAKIHVPTGSQVFWEEEGTALFDAGTEFVEVSGTPDLYAVNGDSVDLFDLKWRERDYIAQMAGYCLNIKERHAQAERFKIHILFGQPKRARVIVMDVPTAQRIVAKALAQALDPEAPYQPHDHCNWCANFLTCKAYQERANAVRDGREDWKLEQYHASKLEDPVELGKALRLARKLSSWCEAVIYHCLQKATKEQVIPDGFELKEKRGNQFVTDLQEAHTLSGFDRQTFATCCTVSLPQLAKKYSELQDLPDKAARKDIEKKLAPVLKRKPNYFTLKDTKAKTKTADNEEE